ncbi:class II aldolase/adducin family protein [Caldalkalibacillus salinus]|uniref:class II aldolase/adducin family protein n=1 Tax=Caldalkalibacillus salinus TaxID=2803787 RepID=UPI001921E889|nr:class II aldolase/adducin family protein [Caldalkalibacillus salinus]
MRNFSIVGDTKTDFTAFFRQGLEKTFTTHGYEYYETPVDDIRVVFNFIDRDRVRPFRRQAQATFVVSVLEEHLRGPIDRIDVLKLAYPYLVRSLSNHFILIVHDAENERSTVSFITPEQGCYQVTYHEDEEEQFFQKVYERLEPLATSRLVIDNIFNTDIPEALSHGDEVTAQLSRSGRRLDEMNLLPAPFPLEEYVTPRDLRHIKKLYGLGGLSYGNLSARKDEARFWMSASGVNKADMKVVGQDMLLINGYDHDNNAMKISVPQDVQPKRASVDAIEHWMIYTEHPDVGAIVHIHAWMDGVQATQINYPCGTLELAETVAELVRQSDDPSRAVIGLKNHGLTITGRSLDDIFDRIEGRILPQVPMS